MMELGSMSGVYAVKNSGLAFSHGSQSSLKVFVSFV